MSLTEGWAKKALRSRYEPIIRRTIHALDKAIEDGEPPCPGFLNSATVAERVMRGIVESSGSNTERKTLTLLEEVVKEVIVDMGKEVGDETKG